MTNHQLNQEWITPVADLKFAHLDKKYLSMRVVGVTLSYIILMGLTLFLLLTDIPWICIMAESIVAAALCVNLAILPKSCKFKGYAFREKDMSYRCGLIFPKVTTIPYGRIQQVSLRQNPVSKIFSLHSVEIVNGAQTLSSVSIPGLDEATARQIKNLLTEKIAD